LAGALLALLALLARDRRGASVFRDFNFASDGGMEAPLLSASAEGTRGEATAIPAVRLPTSRNRRREIMNPPRIEERSRPL
jgi:hypothetical protein